MIGTGETSAVMGSEKGVFFTCGTENIGAFFGIQLTMPVTLFPMKFGGWFPLSACIKK